MVINNLKTLSPEMMQRWQFDLDLAMRHAEYAAAGPDMSVIWQQVFQREGEATPDVDEDLYGGFVGNSDRRQLTALRAMTPQQLASAHPGFEDGRLEELLFRYRARNFPETLSETEQERWEEHRSARLFDGEGGFRTVDILFADIDTLSENADARGEEILGGLYDYAEMIVPQRD
jgi:exodeoxyribonuclease-1